MKEWKELWTTWDAVTLKMIPEDELLSKPINLRHACIFYLGHIPTFLDIHLARATDGKPSEPGYFWTIFERGIDPDVEDPTNCHSHSEIPDEWPPLKTILNYQQTIRMRTKALYSSGAAETNGRVARAMWLGFEHEAMHLETLLYMMVQNERVLPPPGTTVPDFVALAKQSESLRVDNQWFTIPESDVHIGLNNPDEDFESHRYFGWDNESPQRLSRVKSFRAKARPITNGEYAAYLAQTNTTKIPASWCEYPQDDNHVAKRDSVLNGHTNGHTNGTNGYANGHTNGANGHMNGTNGVNGTYSNLTDGKYVRTVYGPIPLKLAMDWPVMASYDEIAGCAQWMGGRIPTMEEVRSIYNYIESMKTAQLQKSHGNGIPAVNG